MRIRALIHAACACVLAGLLPLAGAQERAAAQGAGGASSLTVVVTDPNGSAILSARVRIKGGEEGERAAATNERGEALFEGIKPGRYQLRVEMEGFEPFDLRELVVKTGRNQIRVGLEVGGLKETVTVQQDKREAQTDRRGDSFTSVLTERQIASLPDDPQQFAEALSALAGPNAAIRVNGFSGGSLPPKSQIREIRLRLDPYAAENHDAGLSVVEIYTKPGEDSWHGTFNFGFRDSVFDARNSFAPVKAPDRYRRFGLAMDGPLWRKRTSLFLSADGWLNYEPKTIVAALPEGFFSREILRPTRGLNLMSRVEQKLTTTHTAFVEYQRNATRSDNLGVGGFDLPERAYSADQVEHLLRFRESGTLMKTLVNETLAQVSCRRDSSTPVSDSPAVLVLDSFNRGGAQLLSRRDACELMAADNVDFAFRRHSMRAGALLEWGDYHTRDQQNVGGTFTFASLSAFQMARPTTFTLRVGDPNVSFTQHQLGLYYEDDIRARKNLTFSAGVRYEAQSHLPDHTNFAPRLGLAWSPLASGKVVLRAGAGIFYDWFGALNYEQALLTDGHRQRDLVITDPGFPDPFASGTVVALPPSIIRQDPLMRMPYVEQASALVERNFPKRFDLTLSYFYTRGVRLLRGHNLNAPLPGLGRPDATVGNIIQLESTARSASHLLAVALTHYSKSLFVYFSYDLAKATDEADGPFSLPANNFDLRAERGPSLTDVRHRLFSILDWSITRNLRLGTIFRFSSAAPYNITTGFDDNGDTISNDRPPGVSRNSARGASQWDASMRLSWSLGFGRSLNAGSAGTNVRKIYAGGGGDTFGGLASGEAARKYRLQFYVQAYNVFNHANLMNFVGVESSPFFGHATAARAGRRLETGLRFGF